MFVQWMSFFFFAVAGLLHVLFFVMESILYQRPHGYKIFKTSPDHHQAVKPWALNQGFYNLFLALGMFVGLYFVLSKQIMLAGVLVGFCGLSMIGAGLVLWFSAPNLRRGALIQLVPPTLGFFFLGFHIARFLA
jgi:putative membrane protein